MHSIKETEKERLRKMRGSKTTARRRSWRINGASGRDAISTRAIGQGRRDRDGGRYDGADKAAEKRDGGNKFEGSKGSRTASVEIQKRQEK